MPFGQPIYCHQYMCDNVYFALFCGKPAVVSLFICLLRTGPPLCYPCATTYLQPNMSVFVVGRHPRCFRGCSIHPPAILKCNVQHILSQTHLALYLIIILVHLFSPWHPLVFVMFILLLISASFLPDMPTLLLLPSSPVGLQYPLL